MPRKRLSTMKSTQKMGYFRTYAMITQRVRLDNIFINITIFHSVLRLPEARCMYVGYTYILTVKSIKLLQLNFKIAENATSLTAKTTLTVTDLRKLFNKKVLKCIINF